MKEKEREWYNRVDQPEFVECPTCREIRMYENEANGLTCGACGQLIFRCSAEDHRKLLILAFDTQRLLDDIINQLGNIRTEMLSSSQKSEGVE